MIAALVDRQLHQTLSAAAMQALDSCFGYQSGMSYKVLSIKSRLKIIAPIGITFEDCSFEPSLIAPIGIFSKDCCLQLSVTKSPYWHVLQGLLPWIISY